MIGRHHTPHAASTSPSKIALTRTPLAALFRLGDFLRTLLRKTPSLAARELQITFDLPQIAKKASPFPMLRAFLIIPPMATSPGFIRMGFKGRHLRSDGNSPAPGQKKTCPPRSRSRHHSRHRPPMAQLLESQGKQFSRRGFFKILSPMSSAWPFVDPLYRRIFSAPNFPAPLSEEALRDELQLLHPREDSASLGPPQLFENRPKFSLLGWDWRRLKAASTDWAFQHDYAHRILKRTILGVAELTSLRPSTVILTLSLRPAPIVHYLREERRHGFFRVCTYKP